MTTTCAACGSDRLEKGLLMSAALSLDKQSAWSRAVTGAQVLALACMTCGHVSLSADPEKLRKLIGE
jgi:hypothetical protein